jgi:hypothetical protein
VPERVHQPGEVVLQGARVVTLLRHAGEPDATLVHRDDLELPGERRHDQAGTGRPADDEVMRIPFHER